MSYANLDQVFHGTSDGAMTKMITKILRDEYGSSGSALKLISRRIRVKERTVKNWYEGNSAPNLDHFVKLVAASPKILEQLLLLCGYDDQANSLKNQRLNHTKTDREIICYSIIFDTNDTPIDIDSFRKLKQRHLWFCSEIGLGNKPNARTLSKHWPIGIATAKRDIALLTRLKLICFVGSKRNGFYVSQTS